MSPINYEQIEAVVFSRTNLQEPRILPCLGSVILPRLADSGPGSSGFRETSTNVRKAQRAGRGGLNYMVIN